ncbi:MAG: VTT domain-containing protein [Planctomycetota bacterium]
MRRPHAWARISTVLLLALLLASPDAPSQGASPQPSSADPALAPASAPADAGLLTRLYRWVIRWANTRYALWALALVALAESSFFPIPPDPLLIACVIALPSRAFFYALVTSVMSVVGGIGGYGIGYALYEGVGARIIRFYKLENAFGKVSSYYDRYAGWAVGIAGFTPIPYKLFTIAAGAVRPPVNFSIFVVASALSRSARFFLVAAAIHFLGPRVQDSIEKNINLLSVLFVALLVLGFLAIKFLVRRAESRRLEEEAASHES